LSLLSINETNGTDKCRETGGQPANLILFLQLSTVIVIASFLVREIVDPDTWWQVAIGRDILTHLAVPRTDHFAAVAFGRSYHDSHWFFQVVAALADRLGGMRGVEAVMVALWGATLLCCYRAVRYWLSPSAGCLLVFVVAMACNDRYTPRPDVVTCFMIALFYSRLQAGKYLTASQLVLFALCQVIWSNSHGLFVIGPFMAGCHVLVAVMRRLRGEAAELWPLVKLLAVLLMATLVTPYGFAGWQYALVLMKESSPAAPAFFKTIEELSPTFGATARSFPAFWFYLSLLLAAVLTSIPQLLRRQMSYSRLLIVAMLIVASASGRRNMPLFAVTAAPFVAENVFRSSLRLSCPAVAKGAFALILLALSYLPLSGRYYELFNYYPQRFGLGAATRFFPPGLPVFLHRIHFTGQVYNPNFLGGFCLYHGLLPLTDGRWEVYDQSLLKKVLNAPFDQGAWEWLVATYDVRGVILANGEDETIALFPRLSNDRRFHMAYSDHASSFWLRTGLR
jgi:hypothetical protein